MEDKKGAKERLDAFTDFLRREERSKSTVEKYSREISLFLQWLDGRSIDQEQVIQWNKGGCFGKKSATLLRKNMCG